MTHGEYLGTGGSGHSTGSGRSRSLVFTRISGATTLASFTARRSHLSSFSAASDHTLLLREGDRSGSVDFTSFYVGGLSGSTDVPRDRRVVLRADLGLGMDAGRRGIWVDNFPSSCGSEHLPFFRTMDLYPPFSGAWSIGIEEKFYLVWPLLDFVLWPGGSGPRPVAGRVAASSLLTSFVDALMFLAPTSTCFRGARCVLLHRQSTHVLSRAGSPAVLVATTSVAVILQFAFGNGGVLLRVPVRAARPDPGPRRGGPRDRARVLAGGRLEPAGPWCSWRRSPTPSTWLTGSS